MTTNAIHILLVDKLNEREEQARHLRAAIESPIPTVDGGIKRPFSDAHHAHFETHMGELKETLARVEGDIATLRAELGDAAPPPPPPIVVAPAATS